LQPNIPQVQFHLEVHVKQPKTQINEIVWFTSCMHVPA